MSDDVPIFRNGGGRLNEVRRGAVSLDYDAIAEIYDELYGEEQAAKHREALRAAPPGSGPVLDAGCGTALLAELVDAYYVGLDKSLPMLKEAEKRVKHRAADLLCADAQHAPLRPRAFTAVYSITVVHEAPELIPEALRILKPGGVLVVTLLKKRGEMLPQVLRQLPNPQVVDVEELKDVIVAARRKV